MAIRTEIIGDCTLMLGDCLSVLPTLGKVDAVVTDPPWDQAKGIPGSDDPRGLFRDAAPFIATSSIACIQLGSYTDPCFCAPVAARMPFIHVCWLRYVPPSYNGRVLVDSDVAYVYGKPPASEPGRRVLPSTHTSHKREACEEQFLRRHGKNRTSKKSAETTARLDHPMARRLGHVRWLVKWHTSSLDVVGDPFMGSGTTMVACVQLGRPCVGIEIHEPFFDVACARVRQAVGIGSLFCPERAAVPELFGEVK